MAIDYVEAFRYSRVMELLSMDAPNTDILKEYVLKIEDGTITEQEILTCIRDRECPDLLKYMKLDQFTAENMMHAVKQNGLLLRFIPKSMQHTNINQWAIAENPFALEFVGLPTNEEIKLAIRLNFRVVKLLMERLTTNAIALGTLKYIYDPETKLFHEFYIRKEAETGELIPYINPVGTDEI